MFTVTLLLSTILMSWIIVLIETHWNIIPAHLLHRVFYCLFSSACHSSIHILFRLPHFARPASRKTELQKYDLSGLSALQNTGVFGRFMCKFHCEGNGSELSKGWLARWSENPVEGICGQSLFAEQEHFLCVIFSNKFFPLKQTLKRVTTQREFLRLPSNLDSS